MEASASAGDAGHGADRRRASTASAARPARLSRWGGRTPQGRADSPGWSGHKPGAAVGRCVGRGVRRLAVARSQQAARAREGAPCPGVAAGAASLGSLAGIFPPRHLLGTQTGPLLNGLHT